MRVNAFGVAVMLITCSVLAGCCTNTKATGALPPEGPVVETAGWETHPAAPWNQAEPAAAPRPLVVSADGTAPVAPPAGSDMSDLLAANRRLNEQVSRLMSEVQTMKKPPEPVASAAPEAAPAGASDLAAVRAALARSGASDLDTALNAEGLVAISVPGSLCFASGKAELQPAAQKKLAGVLANLTTQFPGLRLRVEGHTDSDPIRRSKWESNQALSEARASAVADFLVQSGSLKPEQVASVGYGSSRPVSSNDTSAGKAENRRVEIVLLK